MPDYYWRCSASVRTEERGGGRAVLARLVARLTSSSALWRERSSRATTSCSAAVSHSLHIDTTDSSDSVNPRWRFPGVSSRLKLELTSRSLLALVRSSSWADDMPLSDSYRSRIFFHSCALKSKICIALLATPRAEAGSIVWSDCVRVYCVIAWFFSAEERSKKGEAKSTQRTVQWDASSCM